MCAIVDANAASEVFGSDRPAAGTKFLEWLSAGRGTLVVGGKLFEELGVLSSFGSWARQALLSGRMKVENAEAVAVRTDEIEKEGARKSDDPHILALALVSGARLLYSNDRDLQRDFKTKALIDNPRGRVYSTLRDGTFTAAHEKLLSTTTCRPGR